MIGFRRAPMLSVLSITTIAFSLFAFGLFSLVTVNIRKTLTEVESRVEIRAFLADGTPVEVVSAAMGDIGAFPEVSRVEYVSPDSALARARSELGEFKDVFESAFLPASIDIRLFEGHRDPETIKTIPAGSSPSSSSMTSGTARTGSTSCIAFATSPRPRVWYSVSRSRPSR